MCTLSIYEKHRHEKPRADDALTSNFFMKWIFSVETVMHTHFFCNRKARHIFVCLNHEEIFDAEGTRNPWLSSSRRIHHVFTNSRGQETYAISQRTNLFWTDVEYTCTRHLPLFLSDKKSNFWCALNYKLKIFIGYCLIRVNPCRSSHCSENKKIEAIKLWLRALFLFLLFCWVARRTSTEMAGREAVLAYADKNTLLFYAMH